jgi:cytoplasmic tRNA 2-thiolation protein 1
VTLVSSYEKEIVMYAYFKKLDYFSTECIYSPNAYRGFARQLIKDAERLDAGVILDIVHAGETMQFRSGEAGHASTAAGSCERCGYISSQRLCKACVLLDDLATRSSRHVKVEYEVQAEAGSASTAVASCGGKLSW